MLTSSLKFMHIRINGDAKNEAEMRWAQLMNLEDSIIVVE